jgi:hypothetical protein
MGDPIEKCLAVEPDIAAQPHVRDPRPSGFGEEPGCRHSEKFCGLLSSQQIWSSTGVHMDNSSSAAEAFSVSYSLESRL